MGPKKRLFFLFPRRQANNLVCFLFGKKKKKASNYVGVIHIFFKLVYSL